MSRQLLGDLLLQAGVITREQLDAALIFQRKNKGLIGIILINLGYIEKKTLYKYLVKQSEMVISDTR